MHTLSRQIRFSVDPFSADQPWGYNSYASKPGTEGLGLYFAMWVDLKSDLNPDTGFVNDLDADGWQIYGILYETNPF